MLESLKAVWAEAGSLLQPKAASNDEPIETQIEVLGL